MERDGVARGSVRSGLLLLLALGACGLCLASTGSDKVNEGSGDRIAKDSIPRPAKTKAVAPKRSTGSLSTATFSSPETLIAAVGPPDVDDSTAYDVPRPPFVTRKLEYEKEKVRAWYRPGGGATIETEPPYTVWDFFAAQDSETNEPISVAVATKRLSARARRASR